MRGSCHWIRCSFSGEVGFDFLALSEERPDRGFNGGAFFYSYAASISNTSQCYR